VEIDGTTKISYNFIYKEVGKMKYKVILQQSEEGFAVSVPGLPGCHSQGATEQEAIENISNAIAEYLKVVEELVKGKTIREIEVGVVA
jgi:predicted RNase H-like HicB family nuclease